MKHTQNGSSSNTAEGQDNNNSNSELVEKINIKDTPFTAVRLDDKWFLTLGKYRLTDPVQTFDEVEAQAYETTWTRIMSIMQIMIDENEEKKKEKIYTNFTKQTEDIK